MTIWDIQRASQRQEPPHIEEKVFVVEHWSLTLLYWVWGDKADLESHAKLCSCDLSFPKCILALWPAESLASFIW